MLYNLIGTELTCLYYNVGAMSIFSSEPKPEIVISMHRAKGELDQENPKEQITIRVRNSFRLGDKETTGDRQGFVFSVREEEGRPVNGIMPQMYEPLCRMRIAGSESNPRECRLLLLLMTARLCAVISASCG
jgi:hypothetical protein